MLPYKTAIVVLNYLNYKDTIECVDSIIANRYNTAGVVIVDNGSGNDSYKVLKNEYGSNKDIHVIKSKRNIGYAKGNNIGIDYARKYLGAQFVLIVNNDTIFTDENYIDKLLKAYKKDVGCIGGRIILKDNTDQGVYFEYVSAYNVFFWLVNERSKMSGSSFDFPINKGEPQKILHGSAILLTPDFFRYYKGFYPKTFLYGEEAILYYMCKCKNLKQVYIPETAIYHKEDQSSIMSFNNDIEVANTYQYQSRKQVLKWAIRWEFTKRIRKWKSEQI